MKFFETNQNTAERVVRFIVAIFLLPAPLVFQNSPFAISQAIVGVVLVFNALSGICVIYQLFGTNTCKV
tara:strand:- start:41 stop:247 length:207 start_codon:yes stop_codon:yes gene_type:complete